MEYKYNFKKDSWNKSDFRYVYSPICKNFKTFKQEENCIVNDTNKTNDKYSYISLVTEQKFHKGAIIETHCSFEKYGAPLLVISNDISKAPAGFWRYGLHFEIVSYENGINVWRIVAASKTTVNNTNLIRQKFSVDAKKIHLIHAQIKDNGFDISLDNNSFFIEAEQIPNEFHAGFTACEGINRFYDFSITE